MIPHVWRARRRRTVVLAGLALLLVGGWLLHESAYTNAAVRGDDLGQFGLVFVAMFGWASWQVLLCWADRPATVTAWGEAWLDRLRVTINVPCFNEDPDLLSRSLASIFAQSRRPQRVEVVDDGSTIDYGELRRYWLEHHPDDVEFSWITQANAGKRHAQMRTFAAHDDIDIFVPIDSDTVLTRDALREGLKPFLDETVTSVAGLVLALNKHRNVLVKTLDMVVTSWQLTSRASLSMLGSVTVNSGPFALYRADVVRKNLASYTNEEFFGRPVNFSDDSLLTLYAKLDGRTVQQASAIALTTWPESMSHLVRQQLRWTRGMFIRSWWRWRYLPVRSFAYWYSLVGWAQFIVTSVVFGYVFIVWPSVDHRFVWEAVVLAPLLSYATTLRTLTVCRSDESRWQQLGVYLLSPLVVLWAWLVFRPLRIWGILTCLKTGWGTRQTVEVVSS